MNNKIIPYFLLVTVICTGFADCSKYYYFVTYDLARCPKDMTLPKTIEFHPIKGKVGETVFDKSKKSFRFYCPKLKNYNMQVKMDSKSYPWGTYEIQAGIIRNQNKCKFAYAEHMIGPSNGPRNATDARKEIESTLKPFVDYVAEDRFEVLQKTEDFKFSKEKDDYIKWCEEL